MTEEPGGLRAPHRCESTVQGVQIVHVHCRIFRRLSFAAGGRDDDWFFLSCLMLSFLPEVSSFLLFM